MLTLEFHVFFHRDRTLVKRTRQKDQKVSQEWGQHTCIAVMNTTAITSVIPQPVRKLTGSQGWGRELLPPLSSCPPTHSLTELPRKLWCALFKILQLFSPNLRTKCLHVLLLKLWCRLKTLNLLLDFDCSSHYKIIKFPQRRVNKTLCVVILEKGFMLPSVLPSVPHLIPQSGSFFWPLFHQYLC